MSSKFKKCQICNNEFCYTTGYFTIHLLKEHNISLKDYIIKYELNNIIPKCQCGYCDDDAPFYRGTFLTVIKSHTKFENQKEQYLKKNGIPYCSVCGEEIKKWNRGKPNKYCSDKCHYIIQNNFNQEKIKNTVKERYNVDNVMFLKEVKEKHQQSLTDLYLDDKKSKIIKEKVLNTNLERYNVNCVFKSTIIKEKIKHILLNKYGVNLF
jgi:predicted nucleic acid-binding Zn ribbon protein